MNLEAGARLGRYEIRSPLGAGGMGEVYLAEDVKLGRRVALKLLPSQATQDQEGLRRFEQEARAASALSHPNIAHIYEIGEAEGHHFIAMEYVEGQHLGKRINGRPLDAAEVTNIGAQVADALDEAHTHGITHRDIKSANVMLTKRGQVKVLDFGLAKVVNKRGQAVESEIATHVKTKPGVVMGTVTYMSPEQALGREVDARTDIWSLGVVLYEMATGRLPFTGESVTETIDLIAHAQPEAMARFNYDLPPELEVIVKKALRKNREERYQTAHDMLVDLKALQRELEFNAQREHLIAPAVKSNSASSEQVTMTLTRETPQSTREIAPAQTVSSAEYVVSGIKRHRLGATIVFALLTLVVAGLAYGIYRWSIASKKTDLSFQSAKITRLTSTGKASDAGISPDGRYVAHVKSEAGQQSLWLRQVATTSDTQIVPPSRQFYYGITFSKDGNYIYYALGETNNPARTLYQVPVLGGASRKVIESVTSPVSLSPDGTRLAFMRSNALRGESALVVANADGTGERQIAVRKQPNNFSGGGPDWSPDGKLIASGALNYDPASGGAFTVVEVPVEGGAERPITSQKWSSVGQVAWLTDGSGLALIAVEQGTPSAQVWYLSYPGGEVRKITNDLNNYGRLSLTGDSSALVTVQTEGTSNVWIAPQGEASRAKQISSGRYDGAEGMSWMPDGKIIYTSREGGLTDVWSMEQDGKNQKQLTAHARTNNQPWATPDGRYIVFRSIRSGAWSIWRMDTDGGNLKQLTVGPLDNYARSSPDGRWVVYSSARSGAQRLWKVSTDGGESVRLTDKYTINPTVSPDGSLIACHYREDQPNLPYKVAIIPFAGGDPIKVLDFPQSFSGGPGLRWTPDGHALTFIDTVNGVSNIWSLPLDGGAPKQLTDFKTEQIFWFDYSRDGHQLALSRGTQTSDVVLISNFK